MILNIHGTADFARASIIALNLAWDIATELTDKFDFALREGGYDEDEIADEYWTRAQHKLNNALGLIQQGIELGLKSRIAAVSEYLLLLSNSIDSLPRPRRSGVPFNEFRTLDARDLVRVHDLFCSEPVPAALASMFESNRILRNQFIHGVVKSSQVPVHKIYEDVLTGFHLLSLVKGKAWAQARKEYLASVCSDSAVDDLQLPLGRTILEISKVVDLLPRKVLLERLGFDKKARRYLCPAACTEEMDSSDFRDYMSRELVKLAQLSPNLPTSNHVHCCVCQTTSEVAREKCPQCVGNVLHKGEDRVLCLSCGSEMCD